MPFGITPKIADFRTCLEIYSFDLAGKPTDSNFVYYSIYFFVLQYFNQYIFLKNKFTLSNIVFIISFDILKTLFYFDFVIKCLIVLVFSKFYQIANANFITFFGNFIIDKIGILW